ncbi:MAG: carbohydrate kinase family protein [Candidatus Syntrophonatronum acetioxidans]|uniref:Carbohydrate kinase family protein n=1 Tax=Candidatus Syntrophonatronum acetioxidans TaxID=1795816 RepID=A0A424YDX0_9FIRM|nr:MAG: carbohydrate kinase family protein [Candidatus Syntrophonatronum acetioxidans]
MSGATDGVIYGFGALNLDLIFQVPPSLMSELPYKPGYEYYEGREEGDCLLQLLQEKAFLEGMAGGGSAANTVVALSRFGLPCAYIGKVGRDEEGVFVLESLEGVRKKEVTREGRTGLCITLLSGDKRDRSLVLIPNANDTLRYEEIPRTSIYKKASWIHFTSFCGDSPFNAQCRIAREIPPGIKISFDPGMLYARRGLEEIMPILEKTHYIFPEKKEVEILTGYSYEKGSRKLFDLGPNVVLCTLGEKGVFVVFEGGEFHVPAPSVSVVDTTGAGDVFAAGFILSSVRGEPLQKNVEMGIDLAAQSVTGVGRKGYPYPRKPGISNT